MQGDETVLHHSGARNPVDEEVQRIAYDLAEPARDVVRLRWRLGRISRGLRRGRDSRRHGAGQALVFVLRSVVQDIPVVEPAEADPHAPVPLG